VAIAGTGAYEEEIGGARRRLVLRNGEIERFEEQHDLGIFELFEQLMGRGARQPQVRHVRDLVALGLVGGGMADRAADALVAGLGPEHNLDLRQFARALLGVTFLPAVREAAKDAKKPDGSGDDSAEASPIGTPGPGSETSAA